MKLTPLESELIARIRKLEEKVDLLMLKQPLHSTDSNHCKVCGIGWGESSGYVCLRNTCPAKITTS